MNTVIIKTTTPAGRDTKLFRAYDSAGKSLKISASTTGNAEYGVKACAAKALGLVKSKDACTAEDYARIEIKSIGSGTWEATLKAEVYKLPKCEQCGAELPFQDLRVLSVNSDSTEVSVKCEGDNEETDGCGAYYSFWIPHAGWAYQEKSTFD